jgi:hypothetical protein
MTSSWFPEKSMEYMGFREPGALALSLLGLR